MAIHGSKPRKPEYSGSRQIMPNHWPVPSGSRFTDGAQRYKLLKQDGVWKSWRRMAFKKYEELVGIEEGRTDGRWRDEESLLYEAADWADRDHTRRLNVDNEVVGDPDLPASGAGFSMSDRVEALDWAVLNRTKVLAEYQKPSERWGLLAWEIREMLQDARGVTEVLKLYVGIVGKQLQSDAGRGEDSEASISEPIRALSLLEKIDEQQQSA